MNGSWNIGAINPFRYFFGIAVVLGVLFALITHGQTDRPAWLNAFLWQLQTVLPMGLLVGAQLILWRWQRFVALGQWWQLAISGLLGSLLFSPVALVIDVWLLQESIENIFIVWLDEYITVAPPVTLCWLAINWPWIKGFRIEKVPVTVEESATRNATRKGQFNALLGEAGANENSILYLKAELHYLKVACDQVETLLLYNLKDAVAELGAEQGIQCHRSYWVAFSAIARIEKKNRQGELVLNNGKRLPVSRSRMTAVNKALSSLDNS